MRKKKKNTSGGFSLLEIIVGLIIILIGVATLMMLIINSKYFLRQEENKSRAMSTALVKMQEYLAKSYSGLPVGSLTGSEGNINWRVTTTQLYEGTSPKRIPYKKIEVLASYEEASPKGEVSQKEVRLENIVPYPYVHTASTHIPLNSAGSIGLPYSASGAYQRIGGNGLRVEVNFEVQKSAVILYNLALRLNDTEGIDVLDTVYTACFIDGVGPKPVVTRTPIMSQPLINNALGLDDADRLSPGPHTIEIRWYKDTPQGVITLKEANLMVVAVEKE